MGKRFLLLKKIGQYGILVFIVGFGITWGFLFLVPLYDGYNFETISKVSDKYNEPVFLSFQWELDEEELMTGQKVTVLVEVQNLPYNDTNSPELIQVKFDGVGYWKGDTGTKLIDRISRMENVSLHPKINEEKVFTSEPITIRYAVEGIKKVMFCDSNTEPICTEVSDIVEVAPHVKTFEIDITRMSAVAGAIVVILVAFSVLIAYRKNILENE